MIKNDNKQYAVSFEVVTYRNGRTCNSKTNLLHHVRRGEQRNSCASVQATSSSEGKREEYEMVHGSCFGDRVTIERKLGNILNVSEIDEVDAQNYYSHAYAEDSRYNYNG
jgi:hypothetical protein